MTQFVKVKLNLQIFKILHELVDCEYFSKKVKFWNIYKCFTHFLWENKKVQQGFVYLWQTNPCCKQQGIDRQMRTNPCCLQQGIVCQSSHLSLWNYYEKTNWGLIELRRKSQNKWENYFDQVSWRWDKKFRFSRNSHILA